jgi:ABC-type dipeptide/oligopeptide/nickel transport system permease component
MTDVPAPLVLAHAEPADGALEFTSAGPRGAWLVRAATILGRAALLLFFASLFGFLVVRLLPADPALAILESRSLPADPETLSRIRAEWGLDRPLPAQYLAWIANFARGDWGVSFRTGEPVARALLERLPLTATVGFGGLGLAFLAAMPLGRLCCRRRYIDAAVRAVSVGAQSLPIFVLGLLAIWLLAVEWRLIKPFSGTEMPRLIIPIGLIFLARLGRLTLLYRRALFEVTGEAFYRTALAKGFSPARALATQARRFGVLTLIGALVAECGWAIGGTAVIEVLFGLPGIGQFVVQSVAARDYPVLQAYVMLTAAIMALVGMAAHAAREALDPRQRPRDHG